MTFCIFVPSTIFLGNINEFVVDYKSIVPVLIIVGAVVFTVLSVIGIVTSQKKILNIYAAVVFAIAAGLYIQGNFLNGSLGELDGSKLDIQSFGIRNVISTVVWVILIAGCVVFVIIKEKTALKAMKVISYFLSAVQIVTLVVMILTTNRTYNSTYAISKDGQFFLSKKENVVVFVVDTLDSDWAEDFVLDKWGDELKDFTYYDNVVAGGAPTRLGVPLLLTGIQYDTLEPIEEYYKDAFEESNLIKDLNEEGYAVRIYTQQAFVQGVDGALVDNMKEEKEYIIRDYVRFSDILYKMSAYYACPQLIKPLFYVYGDDINITQSAKSKDIEEYKINDVQFYEDFKESGLNECKEKTFVFYHLNGSHSPYTMDENCEKDTMSNLKKQTDGTFKIITEYIDEMKEMGVYDNSTIIITADHGGEALYENPAVFVKEKNTSQEEIKVSSNPATFKNIYGTIANESLTDSNGYEVPIDEADEKERYHVAPWTLSQAYFEDEAFLEAKDFSVFKIMGNADSRQFKIVYDEEEMRSINR